MGLQYHNDVQMIQKLDLDNFDRSEMVVVKIPISIPYATESEAFERVDGLFEHKGEFYRKVKQRLLQDTLHIICVKDKDRSHINNAWEKYVMTFTDNHADSQSSSKVLYNFIKDYLSRSFSILQISRGWDFEIKHRTIIIFSISEFFPSIIHPPEREFF
jgi:hypothetical protein